MAFTITGEQLFQLAGNKMTFSNSFKADQLVIALKFNLHLTIVSDPALTSTNARIDRGRLLVSPEIYATLSTKGSGSPAIIDTLSIQLD
jgi:hypothetical protein